MWQLIYLYLVCQSKKKPGLRKSNKLTYARSEESDQSANQYSMISYHCVLYWVVKESKLRHADGKISNQTGGCTGWCVFPGYKWAMSWQILLVPFANIKGADHPVHQRSLISAFLVRCRDSIIPLVSVPEMSILYLASVAAKAGLSLPLHIPKTGFLVMWLSVVGFPVPSLNWSHGMSKPTRWYAFSEDSN